MNLMMWLEYDGTLPTPAILKPQPLWTGKQILSQLIPNINYTKKGDSDSWACHKDDHVRVKNGEIMCGVFRKPVVGASGGGLV